ncbi:MAG: Rieske 2Fe-2S domain-containing protein [Spirochaetales bacterium]|nr:Rieske 2Fe-2S domain-containing protein [Spirochaetales bacterium]
MRRETDAHGRTLWLFGRPLPDLPSEHGGAAEADWQQARVREIEEVLKRVRKLPSGGWFVVAATDSLGDQPRFFYIDEHEISVWKNGDRITAAVNQCPHMGAPLSEGTVRDGVLTCPWHGMQIAEGKHCRFLQTHDDGVLTWVRFHPSEDSARPVLPPRPQQFIAGVIQFPVRSDPEDIIANRLDPWHGVHFHPHSFARLRVIDNVDDVLTVRVAFRAFGRFGTEVDCTFHCPEPNTIVMTIIRGEGKGSVVETHATPMCPGRTMVTEATLASSERPGFPRALRFADRVRPRIEKRAGALWAEDRAYAERRYYLRHPELLPEMAARSVSEPVGKPRPVNTSGR